MTKAAYSKAALTYQQQLQQLKERGLHIPDENYLLHLLEVKSYYRLSGHGLQIRASGCSQKTVRDLQTEIARLEPFQAISRSNEKTEEFTKFTAEAFYKNY